ncbi:MAG: hypothetical protein ABIT20_13415 [Gemmatimonadaceae bacterium]
MRIRLALLVGAVLVAATGCAHLPAVGQQSADSGAPRASDGLMISMRLTPAAAVDTTVNVLQARGYAVDSRRGARTLRTRPRLIGGDTSMVITAQIIPVDLPDASSMIALSATYSVPSIGVRDVQVQHLTGSSDSMWARLREIEDVLRLLRRVAVNP